MNTKNTWIVIIVLLLLAGGAYWYTVADKEEVVVSENTNGDNTRLSSPDQSEPVPVSEGKLKAATFSGKLEEVNVSCFADGECYVVVDGKHVTTTIGWSQQTVGSVQGVESFGDLQKHIGEQVEVYAKDNNDGTYTLYGSEGFYVKLK